MGNTANLVAPWRPGESGNPSGGSRKATLQRTLREATLHGLAAKLPTELLERLPEELRGLDLETTAQLIATRLLLSALDPNDRHWRDSVTLIAALETHGLASGVDAGREVPVIPDDDERRQKVAEALEEAGQILAKRDAEG